MPAFYWLPYPDTSWHEDTIGRADKRVDKILPFLDGTSAARTSIGTSMPAGNWSEIREGDSIWIPVHGHKYSTDKVSWAVAGGLVSWSAQEFADRLANQLLWSLKFSLDYHLLACFGANNITFFARSFGERLAKAMNNGNYSGTLTAYKGATGMSAARGHQIGTSRASASPWFLMHRGPGAPSHVSISTQDAAKSWPLGRHYK